MIMHSFFAYVVMLDVGFVCFFCLSGRVSIQNLIQSKILEDFIAQFGLERASPLWRSSSFPLRSAIFGRPRLRVFQKVLYIVW